MNKIIFLLLLIPSLVFGASLDATLGIISDLHHSQNSDEITGNLDGFLAGADNWLGLGDIIDTSYPVDPYGPFSANISDLTTAFIGKTFKSVCGNHDDAGVGMVEVYVQGSAVYPGAYWTWDLGTKWRVIAFDNRDDPGFTVPAAKLTWLATQLSRATSNGRYVIIATHNQIGTNLATHTQIVTADDTDGTTIGVTANAVVPFTEGVFLNQSLFLRHGSCSNDDTSCWGWGVVDAINSTTSLTVNIGVNPLRKAYISTNAADYWGTLYAYAMITNSSSVRTVLEAAGNSVVKLALSGHTHLNGTWTVNGIQYRSIGGAISGHPANQDNGYAIIKLYDNGFWTLTGYDEQTSYKYKTCQ